MDSTADSSARSRRRRIGWAAGLVVGGAFAGAVIAAALPASADPSPGPSGAGTEASNAPHSGRGPGAGPRGGGHRGDETPLTGTDAEKARAAALKAVPGATIDRVETDADGAVYEAHLTRPDGSKATVKFDKDFTVTAVQDGMGSHS
jgi:hypothetical protein